MYYEVIFLFNLMDYLSNEIVGYFWINIYRYNKNIRLN